MTITIPVAGIDIYIINNIKYKLNNNQILSQIFIKSINILQNSINLINKQLKLIYNEIEYWRNISELTTYEKHINNLFCQGPVHFLTIIRLYLFDNINTINNDLNVNLRLNILKNKFQILLIILNLLHCIGSDLRNIIEEYDTIWFELQELPKLSLTTADNFSLEELSSNQYLQFINSSKEKITSCLIHIISIFGNDTFPRDGNNEKDFTNQQFYNYSHSLNQLNLPITELAELAEKCVSEAEIEWPATIQANFVRKPTHFQRYWIWYTGLGIATIYSASMIVKHTMNGNIQALIHKASLVIQSNFHEHIMEPFAELIEKFTSLRRREEIVTVEDLKKSKQTLQRMLDEYLANSPPSPNHPQDIGNKSDEDVVMERLMRSYEAQIINPVRGLLFGNLMTAMLIQTQKVKVNMESVVLIMDKVLESNELTIAVTAAIPGIGLIGGFIWSLYRIFIAPKKPQNQDLLKFKLRISLAEIERILSDEISLSNKLNLTNETSNFNSNLNKTSLSTTLSISTPNSNSFLKSSTRLQYLNGLFYFNIYQFVYILNLIFYSIPNEKQSLYLLYNGNGIGIKIENEYHGICRDILDLLNNNVSYETKLRSINRMKLTYKILM